MDFRELVEQCENSTLIPNNNTNNIKTLLENLDIYEYDLWNIDKIEVTFNSNNFVHLKCIKEHSWISTSDCYEFGLFKRLTYKSINNYAFKCLEKFKKRLEKENELIIRSYTFNNVIQKKI